MSEGFIIFTLNILAYSSLIIMIVFIVLLMIVIRNYVNNMLYSKEERNFKKPIIFTMVGWFASIFFSLFYLEILNLIIHL